MFLIFPDPLFIQNIQEFSIEQGLIFTRTEAVLGFVLSLLGNGGRDVAGLGGL